MTKSGHLHRQRLNRFRKAKAFRWRLKLMAWTGRTGFDAYPRNQTL